MCIIEQCTLTLGKNHQPEKNLFDIFLYLMKDNAVNMFSCIKGNTSFVLLCSVMNGI